MITAFCANPCIDRTVTIEKFTYGGMNRITSSRYDGSGKGVNVAIVVQRLGLGGACIGLINRGKSEIVTDRLTGEGCRHEFYYMDGETRVNTKLLDQSRNVVTEINESGTRVDAAALDAMRASVAGWAKQSDYMVFTGSLPPGCPADFYYELSMIARKSSPSCRIVLDTEGEKLSEGLKAHPFLIKPNTYELEMLCGKELNDIHKIHNAALALTDKADIVAVSMGSDGAYVTDGTSSYYAPRMNVEVKSTVGAGDSMVSGYLLAFSRSLGLPEALRYAVAAATSSVMTTGTGLIDVAAFHDLLDKVEIIPVD